jgi:hypothetical protein
MSGPPFNWEAEESHPWLFDWKVEDSYDWPWPPSIYEPCEFGCHLGSVKLGECFWMECPVCAGSGIGGEHAC